MKKLIETRNQKISEMDALLNKAKEENRAFTPEEKEQFDALEAEVKALKETIDAQQRRTAAAATETDPEPTSDDDAEKEKKQAENEERAFANYIRGVVETRAEVNMTEEHAKAVAALRASLAHCDGVDLLPYHTWGLSKAECLACNTTEPFTPPTPEQTAQFAAWMDT